MRGYLAEERDSSCGAVWEAAMAPSYLYINIDIYKHRYTHTYRSQYSAPFLLQLRGYLAEERDSGCGADRQAMPPGHMDYIHIDINIDLSIASLSHYSCVAT